MSVKTHHPDYEKWLCDWQLMRAAIAGDSHVKGEGEKYLPMPRGFRAFGNEQTQMYTDYKRRAQFPEVLSPTVRGMTGIIHRQPAAIELPPALKYLRENATPEGDTLDALHLSVTREILTIGRIGLLTDVAASAANPYLATYTAESIINWADDGSFFVLDESGLVREGFDWVERESYRVLELVNGTYVVRIYDGLDNQVDDDLIPQAARGRMLDQVPFVVIGGIDVTPALDEIPLIQVARANFKQYRLDADLQHQLHLSGYDVLVTTGLQSDDVPQVIGPGVVIGLPAEGDAKWVGPNCKGIEALERAIAAEENRAMQAGAKLYDAEKKAAESGEALKLRWAAQTATLLSIAKCSAQGLERGLRHCAQFLGLDPKTVTVSPNLGFLDSVLTPAEAMELTKIWMAGGMSFHTLYENFTRGGIANPDRDADKEKELIDQEVPDVPDKDTADADADDVDDATTGEPEDTDEAA